MGTHCLIFLTIANLVSPPGFPFAGKVKGRTGPPPPNEKSVRSRRPGKAGPSGRGVCCLAPTTYETRCLLIGRARVQLPSLVFLTLRWLPLAPSFSVLRLSYS